MPRPLSDGQAALGLWYEIINHLENIGELPRNKPRKERHVRFVGGPTQVAHVERQDYDKRGRSPRQREAMIKMDNGGRIAR